MNPELLQKYIAGNATEAEKQRVTEWIQAVSYTHLCRLRDLFLVNCIEVRLQRHNRQDNCLN